MAEKLQRPDGWEIVFWDGWPTEARREFSGPAVVWEGEYVYGRYGIQDGGIAPDDVPLDDALTKEELADFRAVREAYELWQDRLGNIYSEKWDELHNLSQELVRPLQKAESERRRKAAREAHGVKGPDPEQWGERDLPVLKNW